LFCLISCFTGVVLFDFMFYWCCFVWFHVLLMHLCFTGVVLFTFVSLVLGFFMLCFLCVAWLTYMFHWCSFVCCNCIYASLVLFSVIVHWCCLVLCLTHWVFFCFILCFTCVALFIRIRICNVLSDIFPLSLDIVMFILQSDYFF
jgi:hypothetical protein